MQPRTIRVDSAATRVGVAAVGTTLLAFSAYVASAPPLSDQSAGDLVAIGTVAILGFLFAAKAFRWKIVTADEAGLRGLSRERLPWSDVEEIWEPHLSRRQPWPNWMLVRTRARSYRIWTTRVAIERCRELHQQAKQPREL